MGAPIARRASHVVRYVGSMTADARVQVERTHCPAGHAYADHGYSIPSRPTARYCRMCGNERRRARRAAGRP